MGAAPVDLLEDELELPPTAEELPEVLLPPCAELAPAELLEPPFALALPDLALDVPPLPPFDLLLLQPGLEPPLPLLEPPSPESPPTPSSAPPLLGSDLLLRPPVALPFEPDLLLVPPLLSCLLEAGFALVPPFALLLSSVADSPPLAEELSLVLLDGAPAPAEFGVASLPEHAEMPAATRAIKETR